MKAPAIAVVGVGHMGGLHARKLASLQEEGELRLSGVFDRDASRAEEIAFEVGCPIFETLDELIGASDAACIAVPSVDHAETAARLLEAGLDVLVEKPLATTRAQARELVTLAESRDRILQVGHVERFSGAFQEVRSVITRPLFMEVHRIGPYPARATDAGVVLDLMIHDLDLVSLLCGSEIESVEAVGIPVLSRTEDIANARLRFAGGCVVNLTASRVSQDRMRKIRVFQPDAYLSIDFGSGQITAVKRQGELGRDMKISSEQLQFDAGDALLAQDCAFARAVTTRDKPEVSGEDGYRALDLALRIAESFPEFGEIA